MTATNIADQMRTDLTLILCLVESNHYASAFQSLGQYRTALHEFIQQRLDAAGGPITPALARALPSTDTSLGI